MTRDSNFATKVLKLLSMDCISADVYFVIDEDTEKVTIPAHKNILGAISPVFRAMFYGSLTEHTEVNIIDASSQEFKMFIKLFYMDDVPLSMEYISTIMYLCEKYQITEFIHTCSIFLGRMLNLDTVFTIYEFAIFYRLDELIKMCDELIKIEESSIIQTENFLECNKIVLEHILEKGLLQSFPVDVLLASLEWAKYSAKENNCADNFEKIRDQLGNLFFKLPFAALDEDTFEEVIPHYRVFLSNEEFDEIINIVISSDDYEPTIFSPKNTPDIYENHRYVEISRIIMNSFHVKTAESTIFSSDKLILLNGFLCSNIFEFVRSEWHYFICRIPPSRVSILEENNDEALYTGEIKLVTHGESRLDLPTPIIIKPFVKYEIRMMQDITSTIVTFSTLKSNLYLTPDINIQFHPNKTRRFFDTNTANGLVAQLFVTRL